MLIKRVSLENYRSHSNKTVEFTKGVNLILGKNGKGKTSILEAISSVMFNINDRTGRERGKNYIKYGEQNAKVEIEFTANDERDYILTTTFSQKKPRKQKLIDKATEEEYYNDNVKEMLDLLCGIKRGFEKIYENIVIAKQNEFINVFKESPAEREKIFNRIFNTEVYKDICEYFKIARDKYRREKESIFAEINFSKENMEDKEEILVALKNEKEKRDDLENKRDDLIIEVENLIKNIENYSKMDIELKNLNENYLNEINKLEKDKEILKENIIETRNSKKARDIVKKNEKSYFQYLEFQEKLKLEREQQDNLLEEQRLNIQNQHNIEKLELSNKNLKDDINNLENNITKNSITKDNLEREIFELEIKEKNLSFKLEEYLNLLEKLEDLEKVKKEKLDDKLKKMTEINILQKDLASKREVFKLINLKIIEEKLSNFLEIEKELKFLEEQKIIFQTEIKTLKKSSKDLANKICPYLNEECENLKDKKAEDYFSSKIFSITKDLEILKENIEGKSQILLEKQYFEDKKKEYFELERVIENQEISLKNEELNFKEIELNIKTVDMNIQKIFENQEIKDSLLLREKKKEIEVELKNLNLNEKRKNLEILVESLELEKEKVLRMQDSIKENLNQIEKCSKNIVEGTDKKILLLKESIDYLENAIENLKELYDEYLKNNNLAKNLEILLMKVNKNIQDLYFLRTNKNQLKEQINILENKIQKINASELKENYTIKKENLDEINKNLGSSEEKIVVYRKSLHNILEQKKKQKELLVNLKKVENKYNKTLQIIDNVSQMGRFIK